MRKGFIVVFILLLTATGNLTAQTDKGTVMLGGNVSFQASDDASVLLLNPNLGVFVAKNFAIGINANIISSEGFSQWSLGPFARYYFAGSQKGKFFGQGSLSANGGDNSDVFLGVGLTGGYAVFLNQSIAVEVAASYYRIDDYGLFVLGAGFQIHFKKQK